ncbi:hypothetical protein CLCR_02696 [Cladophialophora carrionii]|uniref:Uncharacterized protein n=1 Tax=Cladophialophora carrionii TaxID=86049 RepID=A0A1C1CEC4_9EURO|nr:hypothetical protein CLCR_02696 [Cladophialophora carrionii]
MSVGGKHSPSFHAELINQANNHDDDELDKGHRDQTSHEALGGNGRGLKNLLMMWNVLIVMCICAFPCLGAMNEYNM